MSRDLSRFTPLVGLATIMVLVTACSQVPSTITVKSEQATTMVPTLAATGSGTVHVTPDLAIVSLGVNSTRSTAEEARTVAALAMTDILSVATKLGIDKSDITTSDLSLSPNYVPLCQSGVVYPTTPSTSASPVCTTEPNKVSGFTFSEMISVSVKDLLNIAPLVDGATASGATNVSGVSFTLADPSVAQAQARDKAITAAIAQATQMANTAGVQLVRILSINESTGPIPYANAKMDSFAPTGGTVPTNIMTGSLDVTSNVSISYEIGQ